MFFKKIEFYLFYFNVLTMTNNLSHLENREREHRLKQRATQKRKRCQEILCLQNRKLVCVYINVLRQLSPILFQQTMAFINEKDPTVFVK